MMALALSIAWTVPQEESTPARALQLLEEARRAMERAEELLDGLKVPAAERRERDALEKLSRILEAWRSPAASGGKLADWKRVFGEVERPSRFARPRTKPGAWGRLPPAAHRAMLSAAAEDVPPQFREYWKRYFELLQIPLK